MKIPLSTGIKKKKKKKPFYTKQYKKMLWDNNQVIPKCTLDKYSDCPILYYVNVWDLLQIGLPETAIKSLLLIAIYLERH